MSSPLLPATWPALTDPSSPPPAGPFDTMVDGLTSPFLVDPSDVVITRLMARMVTQILPMAIALFLVPTWVVAVLAIPYLAYLFPRFGGPMVLSVHAVTHRPLLKRRYRWGDKVVTHILPLLVGLAPAGYHPHHVLMHHTENNGEDDLSSTAAYERDNIWHFLHYWVRFAVFGHFHLASWLARRGKWRSLARMVTGEAVFFGFVALALWWKPLAAMVVFVVPFCLLRVFLMVGNWSEHAFVDTDDPTNAFRNSTCLVNTAYNHRCFNAGYHMVHHRTPGLHWTDTVPRFLRDLPKYAEQDAIVFNGVKSNQHVWWYLMWHNYGYLADHLVDIGERRRTHGENIAFLKARVRTTVPHRKGLMEWCEARGPAAG